MRQSGVYAQDGETAMPDVIYKTDCIVHVALYCSSIPRVMLYTQPIV